MFAPQRVLWFLLGGGSAVLALTVYSAVFADADPHNIMETSDNRGQAEIMRRIDELERSMREVLTSAEEPTKQSTRHAVADSDYSASADVASIRESVQHLVSMVQGLQLRQGDSAAYARARELNSEPKKGILIGLRDVLKADPEAERRFWLMGPIDVLQSLGTPTQIDVDATGRRVTWVYEFEQDDGSPVGVYVLFVEGLVVDVS